MFPITLLICEQVSCRLAHPNEDFNHRFPPSEIDIKCWHIKKIETQTRSYSQHVHHLFGSQRQSAGSGCLLFRAARASGEHEATTSPLKSNLAVPVTSPSSNFHSDMGNLLRNLPDPIKHPRYAIKKVCPTYSSANWIFHLPTQQSICRRNLYSYLLHIKIVMFYY